jgi:hypothetical protein
LTFKLFIDIDETEGVNLVEFPMTTFGGQQQGSANYGFNTIRASSTLTMPPRVSSLTPSARVNSTSCFKLCERGAGRQQ